MNTPHDSRLLRAARVVLMAWIFLIVLALDPYVADPAGPVKVLISAAAATLLAVLTAAAALRGLPLQLSPAWWLPVLLLVWHGVCAALSPQPAHAIPLLLPWAAFLVIAFAAVQVLRDTAQTWRVLAVWVIAMTCASLYGFVQAAGLDPFPWSARDIEEYRGLPATFANPNFAGHALVLALPVVAGLIAHGRGLVRLGWVGLALLMSAHLYLTHMRGGPLALLVAAGFVMLLIALRAGRGVAPARSAVWIIAAAIPVVLVAIAGLLTTAAGRDTPVPVDGSLVLRLNGYHGAARLALDEAVTGIGAGRYAVEAPEYWTGYEARWFATTGKWSHHAHNDLLETAAETGLPGAGIYLALMIAGVLLALRRTQRRTERLLGWSLAAAVTAFAVDGLFGFNLRVPVSGGMFFLLWALAAGRGRADAGPQPWTAGVALVVAVVALCFAWGQYRGERQYQWADGGYLYLSTAREEGTPAAALAADFDAVSAALHEAARRLPWDARPEAAQGRLMMLRENWDAAEQAFAAALQRAPKNPDLWSRRAWSAARSGETLTGAAAWRALMRAEGAALRAISFAPGLATAHRTLGLVAELRAARAVSPEAYRRLAIRRYTLALTHGTEARGPVQIALARLHRALDEPDAARRYLAQAAESTPEDPAVWDSFAAHALERGDWEGYASALHRALGREGLPLANQFDLALRLGRVYAGPMHQPDLANTLLGEALQQAPYRIDLWAVPVVAADAGRERDALEALAAVVGPPREDWPEAVRYVLNAEHIVDGESLLRLAQLCFVGEAWARADALAARALALLSEDRLAAGQRMRSEILAKLGRADDALALAKDAYRRDGNNVLTTLNYARRLAEAGKWAAADFQYASLREQVSPGTRMFDDIAAEHAAVQAARTQAEPGSP